MKLEFNDKTQRALTLEKFDLRKNIEVPFFIGQE